MTNEETAMRRIAAGYEICENAKFDSITLDQNIHALVCTGIDQAGRKIELVICPRTRLYSLYYIGTNCSTALNVDTLKEIAELIKAGKC